jgi:nitrate/nitrite transporter NarK
MALRKGRTLKGGKVRHEGALTKQPTATEMFGFLRFIFGAAEGGFFPGILTGSAAAGGIALIGSIGNLGGFVGPYAIGWIKDATGETTLGLVVLAAGPILGRRSCISDGPRFEDEDGGQQHDGRVSR